MIKKTFFALLVSLFCFSAWSDSCELILSAPMFQLTNDLAIGNVTVHDYDKIEMKTIVLTRWVYLSAYDSDFEHTSIGLNAAGELYVLYSDSRIFFGGNRAWLLSGKLKIKEFSIMDTGLLSVTDDQGKLYTIDNDFVKSSLAKMNFYSFYDILFGKTSPDEGFLKELSGANTLERLRPELFLRRSEFNSEI